MSLQKINILLVVFFLLFFSYYTKAEGDIQAEEKLDVTVRIIGYDPTVSLSSITSAPKIEVFYAYVEKGIKGKRNLRYIKIINSYMGSESNFSRENLNGKKSLNLQLNRDKTCDSSVILAVKKNNTSNTERELKITKFVRTLNSKAYQLPYRKKLACYVLSN